MKLRLSSAPTVVAIAAGALLLGACGVQKPAEPAAAAAPESNSSAAVSGPITGPDAVPAVDDSDAKEVAFFGFARANSFASATYQGIEEYAGAHNAKATFFDPNFDAQKQVSQIQDAVTSGRFDVFVVQANDGTAVMPAIEQAVAAGIEVVVEFTPVGPRYDTDQPQIPGTITLIDVPTANGEALGELGVQACESLGDGPCKVAFLEGFKSLPLDNARTKAAHDVLEAAEGVEVVASVEGGYTADTGRKAMQDILQSNPDVDVVIGSSQAVSGAEQAAGADSGIAFIGNGGSRQAVDAVKEGRWFATYCIPEVTSGATAAALGLAAARGAEVPEANSATLLAPQGGRCTADVAEGVEGEYDE
jgi:ribose transport system substrate-binding protein